MESQIVIEIMHFKLKNCGIETFIFLLYQFCVVKHKVRQYIY